MKPFEKPETGRLKPEEIHLAFDEWAAVAIADGLSELEKTVFDRHLAACPQCAALYQKTQIMNESLTAIFENERPAPNFENQLVQAFRKGERRSWFSKIPETITWLLRLRGVQTAGVLAALTLLVTMGNRLTQKTMSPFGKESRVATLSGRLESKNNLEKALVPAVASAVASSDSSDFAKLDSLEIPLGTNDANGSPSVVQGYADGSGGARADGSFADKKSPAPLLAQTQPLARARANQPILDDLKAKDESAASASPFSPSESAPGLVDSRKLIRNATVELEVASFEAALDKLGAAATQSGGYIATKNSARGGNGKLRGSIVIKVLPQQLDGFLLDIRSIGEVKNQSLATQDVTKEYIDTAARLRNAERMEERLLKMLDEAKGKITEILQVEKELGRVRESIEQMTGELKLYDSLVSYATVTLSLSERDLDQPAAFLLRQTGGLDLLADDVDRTYAEARRIAESAQAQISDANVARDANGRVSASLSLLIPAPVADTTLRQLKALGRIANFTSQTVRTAQNGSTTSAGASTAKVENAPAEFRLTIQHDEQTHRRISFTVIAKDLDLAFDEAKKSAANSGAEVVTSNLTRPRNGTGNAALVLRVPAAKHAELVAAFQKLGRASDYEVQRDAAAADETAPVLISLQLTDEEPSIQQTRLSLEATDIEKRAQDFKKTALAAGATVRDSAFTRSPDGRETAQVVLRLPLDKSAALLAQAQTLGETRELTVQRRDIAAGQTTENNAAAELSITLSTENKIVADDSGLFATLRRTLSQAIASLLWSVQMICVALAFLVPWVVGLLVAGFLIKLARKHWRP